MLPWLSPSPSVSPHPPLLPPKIPQPLRLTPTHQDSGDDVSSVLQAVRLVAASHEAGGGHVLLVFIPVANLRRGETCHNPGPAFVKLPLLPSLRKQRWVRTQSMYILHWLVRVIMCKSFRIGSFSHIWLRILQHFHLSGVQTTSDSDFVRHISLSVLYSRMFVVPHYGFHSVRFPLFHPSLYTDTLY